METSTQEKNLCTVEMDLALVRRFQAGNYQALDDLCHSHFDLIDYWAFKVWLQVRRANLDDLKQEACVGFINAAKTYNPSLNEDFHGHARFIIRAALFLSPEIRRVKRSLYKNYRLVMVKQDELMRRLDRKPTIEELRDETKLTIRQVNNALNVIAAFPFPLEESEEGDVVDEPYHVEDPYQRKLIEDAIEQLIPNQKEVIIRQYFRGQTQKQIAEELGTTEGAIKMRRDRAIRNLRKIISRKGVQRDGT